MPVVVGDDLEACADAGPRVRRALHRRHGQPGAELLQPARGPDGLRRGGRARSRTATWPATTPARRRPCRSSSSTRPALIGPVERIADRLRALRRRGRHHADRRDVRADRSRSGSRTLRTARRSGWSWPGWPRESSWFEAIVLGLVQGLTEFLPDLLDGAPADRLGAASAGRDPGAAFTAVIQIGTDRRGASSTSARTSADHRRCLGRGRSSSPSCAATASTPGWAGTSSSARSRSAVARASLFRHEIETGARDLWLVAADDDRGRRRARVRRPGRAPGKDAAPTSTCATALIYGLAQCLRPDPGRLPVGRDDLRRPVPRLHPRGGDAVLVPAVDPGGPRLRASSRRSTSARTPASAWGPTLVATVIAFVVGYAVIAWLLRYVATHSFLPFVIYRIAVGVLLLVLLATGTLAAR